MADPADNADKEVEAGLALARSRRKPEGPEAKGKCLCCNSPLPLGIRWCDKSCQEDWELDQQAAERMKGGCNGPSAIRR